MIKKNNNDLRPSNKIYGWAIAMGLLGYYGSSLFDFIGLQYVSAGIERIILFIYPTLAVLINYWIFKVPIIKKQWWAILVTYVGIGLAYWSEINQFQNTELFVFGSIMVLLCGITYALYLVGTGNPLTTGIFKFGVSNFLQTDHPSKPRLYIAIQN